MATYVNIPSSATSLNSASYVNIPSSTFLPSSVIGLELWLDGRDLVGADGTAIATWLKRAGTSGTDAGQAVAGNKPLIKSGANGLNNLPVARFDGIDDYMQSTVNAGSTGFTIYIVGRTGASTPAFQTVVGSGGTGAYANPTTGIWWDFGRGTDATFGAGWAGPTGAIGLGGVTGIAINQGYYARYQMNKVAWAIDGPNSGTPADTSFPSSTYQVYLGASGISGSPQNPFNGDIAAVLMFSTFVSGANDALIKTYLKNTWGV